MAEGNFDLSKSASRESFFKKNIKTVLRGTQGKIMAAVLIGTTLASQGCSAQTQTIENKPGIEVKGNLASQENAWSKLSSKVRLENIVTKKYPKFESFNLQKEATTAIVQEYCKYVSADNPEEISNSIHFVEESEFEPIFAKNAGESLSQEDIKTRLKQTVGITTSEGEIYFNDKYLNEIAKNSANAPELVKSAKLKGYDIESLFKVGVIAHELTHKFLKKQVSTFDPFSFNKPTDENIVEFNRINGFRLEGNDQYGREAFIQGSNEAIVDTVAGILMEEKMNIPYLTTPLYSQGSNFVRRMMVISEISSDDILRYFDGTLSQSEFLEKWGRCNNNPNFKASDLKKGAVLLGQIGMVVQGVTPYDFVDNQINKNFSPKTK